MSDLIIEKRKNLGFVPEVVGYLASIKEFEYSYKEYNLRHPCAIFNLSSHYVIQDFIDILTELEENQNNYIRRKSNLGIKFRNLINNFFKFRDSCYEILVSCSKKHSPPFERQFLWRWLEANKYESGKEFFNKTKDEVGFFEKIYNKLKHTSNVIQPVDFLNRNNKGIMGFYLEGIDSKGSVGPDESLHPRFHGQNTGNSYNFVLRKLYYLLYKVSEIIKEVLIKHFKDVYNIDLPFNDAYDNSNDKIWKELYERMNRLPEAYFPNEFGKETYRSKDLNNKLVFVKIPAKYTDLTEWGIDSYGIGDGFTRSYRLLFYQSYPSSQTKKK